jgi:hypothetical protein
MKEEFRQRKREVERYLRFVHRIDAGKHLVVERNGTSPAYKSAELSDIIKTLKANTFLLLYNLLEATLKNAVESIFDELNTQSVDFDSCREELRRVILGNLKNRDVLKILPKINQLATDIINSSFVKERLFAGNVDGRAIRSAAAEYGFAAPRKKSDELLTVKTNRNDLAHGNKTFGDVGKDYDVKRLTDITKEVIEYLAELIDNVEHYLKQRHYLHQGTSAIKAKTP